MRTLALLALLALTPVACGDSASRPAAYDDGGVTDVGTDSGDSDVSSGALTWDELRARYGNITTVAGLGELRDKGVNGWEARFEGRSATAAELSRPHIALDDGAGNIIIADKDGHGVRSVSPDGAIGTIAGVSEVGDDGDEPGPANQRHLASPNGAWVSDSGVLYIFDLGNDKVRKVDADGTMTTLFSVGGSGTGRGLWVADDESVAYVAAGAQLKEWTPAGGVRVLAGGFISLGNIHVAPDGTLGVADRDGHTVYAIDRATGDKTIIAGNGTLDGGGDGELAIETGLNEVRGLWFHPEGGFFVATHKGGQVWYVDTDGRIHLFVDGDTDHTHAGDDGPYDAPGPKISEPRAVTMTRSGDVLITENDHGFVRRVALR